MKYIIKIAAMTAIMALCATSFAQSDNGNQGGSAQNGTPQNNYTTLTVKVNMPNVQPYANKAAVTVKWYNGQLITGCYSNAIQTDSQESGGSTVLYFYDFWAPTHCLQPGNPYVIISAKGFDIFQNKQVNATCPITVPIVPGGNNFFEITSGMWTGSPFPPCPVVYQPGQESTE